MRQRNRERRLLRFTSVEQSMHFSGGDAYILASYFFPINKKRKNMSDSEIFPAARRREPLPEMQGGIQYIAEPC